MTTTILPMVEAIARSIRGRLPAEEAPAFDAAVAAAAVTGRDLSRVPWRFLAQELRSLPPGPPEIQTVVDPVITGLDLLAAGQEWPEAAARADATKAVTAVWAAARASAAAAAAKAIAKVAAADRVDAADRVAARARAADAVTWADAAAATDWAASATARAASAATRAAAPDDDAAWAVGGGVVDWAAAMRQRDLLLQLLAEA
jgi:hypothetical protein